MGRTVPSYRMALDWEIKQWQGFRKALTDVDQEAFDELMDNCRSLAMAGSNATNPIIFEPMAMSMLLTQQKRIQELEKKLTSTADLIRR